VRIDLARRERSEGCGGECRLFRVPVTDFVPDSVSARAELAAACAPVRAVSNKVTP
jgi:hypothetical protein